MFGIVSARESDNNDSTKVQEVITEGLESRAKVIKHKCRIQTLELKVCQLEFLTSSTTFKPLRKAPPCDEYLAELEACRSSIKFEENGSFSYRTPYPDPSYNCVQRGWVVFCKKN